MTLALLGVFTLFYAASAVIGSIAARSVVNVAMAKRIMPRRLLQRLARR
jgi:hypothetical protein